MLRRCCCCRRARHIAASAARKALMLRALPLRYDGGARAVARGSKAMIARYATLHGCCRWRGAAACRCLR